MAVVNRILVPSLFLLTLLGAVFAQTLQDTATPTESKYGPYPKPCEYTSWNGDNFCLYFISGDVTPDLDKIKSKMLETISEDYFIGHFDLLYFGGRTASRAMFDYRIDEYSFAEVQDYETSDPYFIRGYTVDANNLSDINQPREITNVIGKDVVASEARKCIGTKNVDYVIKEGFTLFATGYEPNGGNNFEMNLETGEKSCWVVVFSVAIPGQGGSSIKS